MKGNKLCLCFLLAAGVGLGAHAQNKIAAPMKDVNQVVDNTLDSLNVARSARPVSGSSRKELKVKLNCPLNYQIPSIERAESKEG